MIKFRFASENPRIEKVISSHLVIGVFSKKFLRSSIFSNSTFEEEQPILKSISFLSTKEWNPAIRKFITKRKNVRGFKIKYLFAWYRIDTKINAKYGILWYTQSLQGGKLKKNSKENAETKTPTEINKIIAKKNLSEKTKLRVFKKFFRV